MQVEAHFFCPCASGLTCKDAFYMELGFKFPDGERCVADAPKEKEWNEEEDVWSEFKHNYSSTGFWIAMMK